MFASACLWAMLAQTPTPPRDVRLAATATGSISGRVLTDAASPRPLRRARVSLTGGPLDSGQTVITGDDGAFAFESLPPGRYELIAAKDAYVEMAYGATRPGPGLPLVVAAGEAMRVDMRLPRGAVITGTVLDADGQPAQGVAVLALARRITLARPDYRDSGSPALPTDDRGVYRIYGLPAGEYLLSAQPHGRTIGFPAGESVRRMVRGAPAERTLAISQTFYPSTADVAQAARITVSAGEERSGVDIQLQYVPLATISGVARVDQGFMPPQVTLVRVDEMTTTTPSLSTVGDAEGRFVFRGVPPGQYSVLARTARQGAPPRVESTSTGGMSISPPVRLGGSIDLTIAGDDVTDLAVAMQPSLTMTGRVEYAGVRPPMPLSELQIGAPATIAMAAAGYQFPLLRIAPDGGFRAEGIEPGTYRFEAHTVAGRRSSRARATSMVAAGVDLLAEPIDVRHNLDGVVITIAMGGSDVSGRVTDAAGTPIERAWVVAFSADRSQWFYHSRRVTGVRSDSAGRYAIDGLPAGEYRLAAAMDLVPGEWFDAAVLERLAAVAVPLTMGDVERRAIDLTIR